MLKFFRWHFLVKLEIKKIDISQSVLLFGLGQIMSISPGKFGEVIKSYFLKKNNNIDYEISIPLVIAERFSEFLTLLLIQTILLIYFWENLIILFVLILASSILIIAISNSKIYGKIINILSKFKFLNIDSTKMAILHESQKILVNPKIYILSIFAWLMEFFCFYIILSNFITDIFVLKAISSYSLAIILGSVSMLPGGLGTTESSLTYLLIQNGIEINIAVAVTIFIRIFTLWIPIIIGFLSLYLYWKRNQKIL